MFKTFKTSRKHKNPPEDQTWQWKNIQLVIKSGKLDFSPFSSVIFQIWLVVWNMNFIFPIFVGMMIQSDSRSIIFQGARYTTNQLITSHQW